MAGFIKLTNYYDGVPIWINPEKVWVIYKGANDKSTYMYSTITSEYWCVVEKPEEVMELIEKQKQN